jgi:hypothetical protein
VPTTLQTDRLIAELAARQHGLVTRGQLLGMGVPSDSVRWRVRVKRLAPVHRGVYRVGPLSSPREREMAAVLACGAGATISHWSGARLWQVWWSHGAEDPVDVTVACADRGRRPGIRGIASAAPCTPTTSRSSTASPSPRSRAPSSTSPDGPTRLSCGGCSRARRRWTLRPIRQSAGNRRGI